MKKIVFLDTNVILDFFLDRTPFSDHSAAILSLAVDKSIKAYVSPLTMSNCYYILRKLASHQKVIAKLKLLVGLVDLTKMNKQTVEIALSSGFTDFEDALQNFSAVDHGKLDVIITRNTKDYKKSELAVMTPETFLKTFFS